MRAHTRRKPEQRPNLRWDGCASEFDRFDLADESGRAGRQERGHDVEHRVAEPADVQDVGPLRHAKSAANRR